MGRLALGIVLWLVLAGVAAAGPLYDTPVYHPGTESYFELVNIRTQYPNKFGRDATGWHKVVKLASQRAYRGRRGRLAVVKSKEVNDFLRDTFKPDRSAWIGLHYICKEKRLVWVTGEPLTKHSYQNWGKVWNAAGADPSGKRRVKNCNNYANKWPVHYWRVDEGFHWNANGSFKHQRAFFVEYPAPKK
jgi:hypothetical protein